MSAYRTDDWRLKFVWHKFDFRPRNFGRYYDSCGQEIDKASYERLVATAQGRDAGRGGVMSYDRQPLASGKTGGAYGPSRSASHTGGSRSRSRNISSHCEDTCSRSQSRSRSRADSSYSSHRSRRPSNYDAVPTDAYGGFAPAPRRSRSHRSHSTSHRSQSSRVPSAAENAAQAGYRASVIGARAGGKTRMAMDELKRRG